MGRHGSAARGRRADGGFTLVELLVVLATVALLAMVGVPALGSLVERSRVASATTAMAVSLANVRMRAVESATPVHPVPEHDAARTASAAATGAGAGSRSPTSTARASARRPKRSRTGSRRRPRRMSASSRRRGARAWYSSPTAAPGAAT